MTSSNYVRGRSFIKKNTSFTVHTGTRQVINNVSRKSLEALPFFCCGSAVIHYQGIVSSKEIKGKAKNRNL